MNRFNESYVKITNEPRIHSQYCINVEAKPIESQALKPKLAICCITSQSIVIMQTIITHPLVLERQDIARVITIYSEIQETKENEFLHLGHSTDLSYEYLIKARHVGIVQ